MPPRPAILTANLGMLLVALLWGAQVPVVHHLAERWDPMFLALVRYVVAVVVSMALGVVPRTGQVVGGLLVLSGLVVAQMTDRRGS